jgi:hypothetical protein
MFGPKTKPVHQPHVADFSDEAVKRALTGEWLTLALARFASTTVIKAFDDGRRPEPAGQGVVHFPYGMDRMLRAELILYSDPEAKPRIGVASFDSMRKDATTDSGVEQVTMVVRVSDPHGTFKEALHRAFLHSAASAERFVHVNFRREKLDPDAFIPGLIEKNYGAYHDLTEAQVSRQTLLPNAPRWGWSWSAER